jgi:hypothetical protein
VSSNTTSPRPTKPKQRPTDDQKTIATLRARLEAQAEQSALRNTLPGFVPAKAAPGHRAPTLRLAMGFHTGANSGKACLCCQRPTAGHVAVGVYIEEPNGEWCMLWSMCRECHGRGLSVLRNAFIRDARKHLGEALAHLPATVEPESMDVTNATDGADSASYRLGYARGLILDVGEAWTPISHPERPRA